MISWEWFRKLVFKMRQPRFLYLAEAWLQVLVVLYWGVVTVVSCQKVYYALQTHPDVWVVGHVEQCRDVYRKRGSRGRAHDAVIEVSFTYLGKHYTVREKGFNFNNSIYEQAKTRRWIKIYVVPEHPEESMMSPGVTGKDWTLLVITCLVELLLVGYTWHIFRQLYRKNTPWV